MAKKAKLSLVEPAATGTPPPRSLGKHGLALWKEVTSEYQIDDRGGIEILMQICSATDRVEALAAQVDEAGEIVKGKTGLKIHPGVREELQLRAFITRNLQRLGLNLEAVRPMGRPPGGGRSWE